jgi:subtilase family serine protease
MPDETEVKYAILKSPAGLSILDRKNNPNLPFKEFLPSENDAKKTAEILRKKGFEVIYIGLTHIAIRGTKIQFQTALSSAKSEFDLDPSTSRTDAFETKSPQPLGRTSARSQPESTESEVAPDLAPFVRAIGSKVPIKLLNGVGTPSSEPPKLGYYYLEPPDDIIRLLARGAHSRNIKGEGIVIAVVDSGFMMPFHPYFEGRGYEIKEVVAIEGDENPKKDPTGHGTAMAACVLALAPEATLIPIKALIGVEEYYPRAFEKAIQAKPDIISCSWGYPEDYLGNDPTFDLLDNLIDRAVEEGITVLCASGNLEPDNSLQWPSSKPNIVSVGGAFINEQGKIVASDFAVSRHSVINPNRHCPDCCGLCGMKVNNAAYIALPVSPNEDYNYELSTFFGDCSTTYDGWVITSGTSAATALAAGVAALWMEANPSLKGEPDKVKRELMKHCIPIREGTSSTGEPANLATGAGLVQAF